MPGRNISGDQNINTVHFNIISEICKSLDQNSKWRMLIDVVKDKRFEIRNTDVETIARVFHTVPTAGQGPSQTLWNKYGDLGMKVRHMHKYLEELKMEKALLLLQKKSEPLVITKPPKLQYVADYRRPLQIKCEAKGFPFPRYTWFKVTEGSTEVQEVDQNTTGILEIKQARRNDAGQYKCRIHNSLALEKGNPSERNVLFTGWCEVQVMMTDEDDDSEDSASDEGSDSRVPVYGSSLVIRRQTKRPTHNINMKGRLYLECKARGTAPLKYQWIKDDMILKDQTTSKLLIAMCWPADSGIYWCNVRSGDHAEINSMKYTVKILDPQVHPETEVLVILRCPQELVKVSEGGQAMFTCDASTREGHLVYKWFHTSADGSVVPVACGRGGVLRIDHVTYQKTGKYYCEVHAVDDKSQETIQAKRTRDCELLIIDEVLPQLMSPTDKIALFIGVEKYRANSNLAAVPFDIQAVQYLFQTMGFKVLSLLDLTLKEMHQAIDLVCDFTEPGVYVVLYFVGHGFYLNGNHYLMPWDVQHGNKLEECLCLEEAHAKVQHKEPTFLFMVNDICREDGRDKAICVTEDVPTYRPKISGNSLIIFAASRTERSYEPVLHNAHLHEEKRGVFSRHFCETLTAYKDRPVVELYNHLQDCFRKKYVDTYGKKYPMHPVMEVNVLEWHRKLTDPIDYTGREIEAEKRNKNFSYITQLPTEKCLIQVNKPEISFVLEMSFEENFSNQFVIILNLIQAMAEPKSYLNFDLSTGSGHNTITKHMESSHYQTRFIFSDIQRLKENLDLTLHVQYTIGGEPRSLININLMQKFSESERDILKRPLISRSPIWSQTPKKALPVREPTEDEEDNHSLPSDKDYLGQALSTVFISP